MTPEAKRITEALAAPFDPSEVKFKPQSVKGNRALALAYVDARVIQDRLDDVLGVDGWQDEYECLPDGSVVCKLQLRIGTDWVTKMDVGSPSEQPDGGDRLKAAFSDALKRAAVKFGVGRYLYRQPAQWADFDTQKKQFSRQPTPPGPKPAKPKREMSGEELARRLRDHDTRLTQQGRCGPGDLVKEVTQAFVKAGFGDDPSRWPAAALDVAARTTRAFEAAHPVPERKAVA